MGRAPGHSRAGAGPVKPPLGPCGGPTVFGLAGGVGGGAQGAPSPTALPGEGPKLRPPEGGAG